jgi:hypothetical protein
VFAFAPGESHGRRFGNDPRACILISTTADNPIRFPVVTGKLFFTYSSVLFPFDDCGNITNADGSFTTEPVIVMLPTSLDVFDRVGELKRIGLNLVGTVVGSVDGALELSLGGKSDNELAQQDFPLIRITTIQMNTLRQNCLASSALMVEDPLRGSDVVAFGEFDDSGGDTDMKLFIRSSGMLIVYILMALTSCIVAGPFSIQNRWASGLLLTALIRDTSSAMATVKLVFFRRDTQQQCWPGLFSSLSVGLLNSKLALCVSYLYNGTLSPRYYSYLKCVCY